MDTAILNRRSSLVSHWTDKKLLWACSLISAKVYFIVEDMLFEDTAFIKKFSIKQKLEFFNKFGPVIAPESYAHQLRENILEYIYLSSLKFKTNAKVARVMALRHYFDKFEQVYYNVTQKVLEASGIKNLYELNKSSAEKFITFTSTISDVEHLTDTEHSAKIFLETVLNKNALPVFDKSIKDTTVYKDGSSTECRFLLTNQPVLKLPVSQSLTCEQLKSIRNELVPGLKYLSSLMMSLLERQERIRFAGEYTPDFEESFIDESLANNETLIEAQNIIDTLPGKTGISSSSEAFREYKIYYGLCSAKGLIKIYSELKIISELTAAYFETQSENSNNIKDLIPFLVFDSGEYEQE